MGKRTPDFQPWEAPTRVWHDPLVRLEALEAWTRHKTTHGLRVVGSIRRAQT